MTYLRNVYQNTEVFAEYELNPASEDKDHDYTLVETGTPNDTDEMEQYYCWEVVDEPFELAVEDSTPPAAMEAAKEEGWDTKHASELEREKIKKVKADVREETAFYREERPEERFIAIGRRRTKKFLESRGVWERVGRLEDSWVYPETEEFVAVFSSVDASGEAARVVWRASELSQTDLDVLLDGADPEELDEQPHRTIDEIADLIDENSPVGTREAEILACYLHGIDSHAMMAEELDPERGSIASSAYHLESKIEGMAWLLVNVIAHVEEDQRPDEVNEMLENVETGNPISHDEIDMTGDLLIR